MKIIKRKEIKEIKRPFGRIVQKLLGCKFIRPKDSMAMFLSFSPKAKLDFHYHANTEEIIIFPEGGKIEVDDKLYNMDPWDAVFLEPGEIHGFDGEYKDVMHLALRFPDNEDKISADKK